jgi:hypothetical protein
VDVILCYAPLFPQLNVFVVPFDGLLFDNSVLCKLSVLAGAILGISNTLLFPAFFEKVLGRLVKLFEVGIQRREFRISLSVAQQSAP